MNILIATDIDGTLTSHPHIIPPNVLSYLEELSHQGIEILFVTGRPYQRSYPSLKSLKFPFLLAVYNGSLVFKMPESEVVHREYLSADILNAFVTLCEDEQTDVVVYGGYEHQDLCYYRPNFFSKDLLSYVHHRCERLNETWIPIESFDDLPIRQFPSVKCFGTREELLQLTTKIGTQLDLYAPVIHDALSIYSIAQFTKKGIHKGHAIESVKALKPTKNYKVIACGDDFNDFEMLTSADVSVVMATAPKELLSIGDVIAPPSHQEGIIFGLKEALKRIL